MVFTLHRYVLRELLRIFVLATLALTVMMSLGIILRPVQEYGVGPGQVIHLMGYFLPIILTYVLPIAALFAGALVYGRFASDNELDACRASGISLLTMVYPGLVLAIIVATANLILSFHVIPAFVQRAEKALKADAQKIIFRNIQRKGFYKSTEGGYLIYADNADLKSEVLTGVVITKLNDALIERIISADRAKVHFNPQRSFNEVQITAYNTYQMGAENFWYLGKSSFSEQFSPMLGDDISFKKIDEMKEIKAKPMRFSPIASIARNVYAQFTVELLVQDIAAKIADFPNNYYTLYSGERFIKFTATECKAAGDREIDLTGEVWIIEYDADMKPLRTLQSTKAMLYIEGDELSPTLTLQVYNPILKRMDGSEDLAGRQSIRGLILPASITDEFKTENVLRSIEPNTVAAALTNSPSDKLEDLQKVLEKKIRDTLVAIKAEVNSRLAFGVGCVPLIMIGIGLGIMKKGGHLLSAFGVSFMPAAMLIVSIMMGKNIAKNPGSTPETGIALMWAVTALLSLLAVVLYRKLLKN